jgi:lipid-binding SYLF domain-containing protein
VVLAGATIAADKKSDKAAEEREKLGREVQEAIEVFKKTDSGLLEFFEESAGYAVFPKIAKGAVGIGAAHGKGELFERGKVAGSTEMTQVTVGLQLGGQVYAEVVFFEEQKTLDDFKRGNFEFSAQVSAVAAAEGASKNAKYKLGVVVFTVARGGLMYEASIGGQKFSFEPYTAPAS